MIGLKILQEKKTPQTNTTTSPAKLIILVSSGLVPQINFGKLTLATVCFLVILCDFCFVVYNIVYCLNISKFYSVKIKCACMTLEFHFCPGNYLLNLILIFFSSLLFLWLQIFILKFDPILLCLRKELETAHYFPSPQIHIQFSHRVYEGTYAF